MVIGVRTGIRVGPWRQDLTGLALIALLGSCSTAPGSAETDRVATTVSAAMGYPRKHSADELVRAAVTKDSRLTVVEAQELTAKTTVDPLARLVMRVHIEGSRSGLSSSEPISACYEARFNFYGVIGRPHRVDCPPGARAIVPDPLPAKPRAVIPEGFDSALRDLLATLPALPDAGDVRVSVSGRLPAPGIDPNSGLGNLPPTVEAAVSGADVGVSVWAPDDRDCLLGARTNGKVMVGRPSSVQMHPGELSCDPQTALHFADMRPPH